MEPSQKVYEPGKQYNIPHRSGLHVIELPAARFDQWHHAVRLPCHIWPGRHHVRVSCVHFLSSEIQTFSTICLSSSDTQRLCAVDDGFHDGRGSDDLGTLDQVLLRNASRPGTRSTGPETTATREKFLH